MAQVKGRVSRKPRQRFGPETPSQKFKSLLVCRPHFLLHDFSRMNSCSLRPKFYARKCVVLKTQTFKEVFSGLSRNRGPFLEGPEKFLGPDSQNKNLITLSLQGFPFHRILIRTKLISMQSLKPIHCFLFEIQIVKNGFTGPIRYRVFRETGPRSLGPWPQLFETRKPLFTG